VTTGEYETASELDLQLFERQFMKGDLVKHTLTDIESAVVIDTKTECKLGHVISGERLPRWIPWNQLRNAVQIEAKDRVVYDEWIGTVEEVLEEGLVESRFGPCYSIAEMGGLLETGRRAAEVVPENTSVMNSLWQFPPYAHPADDRVVTVRPLIIFIVWNAINQTVSEAVICLPGRGETDARSCPSPSTTSTPSPRVSGAAPTLRSSPTLRS
jgi:ubiquitin-conjugating enzyme E2 O